MEPTTDRPLPPPLPRPAVPLRYGAEPAPPPGNFLLRMMLGFFGYLGVSAAWAYLAVRLRLRGEVLWGVWVLMTGALLALALYLRVRFRFSGFGYGILTALLVGMLLVVGLVVLLIGMCFKGLSNNM
jgi:hypothetical protein